MELVLASILLVIGFALLIKGANYTISGASSLALKFRISAIVIGLTVVSFGTSAPELVVNVMAALKGNVDISYGNIIGSNIINILLILGVSSVIRPLYAQRGTIRREIPFSLLAVLALAIMSNDALLSGGKNILARNDGMILLMFFLIFIVYTFALPKIEVEELPDVDETSPVKIIFLIIIGFTGLFLGGRLVVKNAVILAEHFGMSDRVIGLTVVAIGTSLPELVTSAVAAKQNKVEIAIGNVVGSNICNILLILGITSIIQPLPFQNQTNIDLMVLVVASAALFFSVYIGRNHRINQWEGVIFLFFYTSYTLYLLLWG